MGVRFVLDVGSNVDCVVVLWFRCGYFVDLVWRAI